MSKTNCNGGIFCYCSHSLIKMKTSHNICVIALAVGTALFVATGVVVADNLIATDKEVKINVPVLTNSLPVQFGSSLSTQYTSDQTPDPSAGIMHLGTMTLEEGIRYPSLIGEIYARNSIGEKLMPTLNDRLPMMSPNSAYLTSWLTKQWASVNLSLSHIHLIERPDNQLAGGVSKAVTVLHGMLSFTMGEYLFSDLDNRYWSRTTDLSMDYNWKRWDFSMSIEQQQDLNLSYNSVQAAIKTKF